MKSKWFFVVSVVSLALSACGTSTSSSGMKTEIGKGEGEVAIIAWPGYIERGDSDPDVDWVTEFEDQTQCKVTVEIIDSSDEMVTLMNEGGFDLVTASGEISTFLIETDKVQPINIDLIPSWNTLDEHLQNAPWHTVNNIHYGVPYQWMPSLLLYSTEVFPEPPTSWNVTFEEMNLPDGESNKGRVQAFNDPLYIADAALYLKYHNPEWGIENPYDLKQEQFDAAVDLLRKQREIVHGYWRDALMQIDDFKNEVIVASSSWPFQVTSLQGEGVNIASTIPQEEVTGIADTTMLNVNAPHPNCAYRWLEWSLNLKLQSDVANWFGSVPVVPTACEGNELLTHIGCATFNQIEKVWFWRRPTADCSDGSGGCVPYSKWAEAFTSVMSP